MQTISHPGRVITLDRKDFETACADLLKLVRADLKPCLLVGVRTGGFVVAEAMARASAEDLPILPITCRRPSSRFKNVTAPARKLIASLPRPMLDHLRVIEHAVLTRKTRSERPVRMIDADELADFDVWAAGAGAAPNVVIVDDAVDTGATLARVTDVIRARMPPLGRLRTAAVTVTTTSPEAMPDYVLLRQKMCRFPWSLDAGVQQAC
jgi:hypoxanthine phosphoribosyltransferase